MFHGGGLPRDRVVLVVRELDGVEDGAIHESDMLQVGEAGERNRVLIIEGLTTIGDPSTPCGRLADAAIDAENHLHAFTIREGAGIGGSKGK